MSPEEAQTRLMGVIGMFVVSAIAFLASRWFAKKSTAPERAVGDFLQFSAWGWLVAAAVLRWVPLPFDDALPTSIVAFLAISSIGTFRLLKNLKNGQKGGKP